MQCVLKKMGQLGSFALISALAVIVAWGIDTWISTANAQSEGTFLSFRSQSGDYIGGGRQEGVATFEMGFACACQEKMSSGNVHGANHVVLMCVDMNGGGGATAHAVCRVVSCILCTENTWGLTCRTPMFANRRSGKRDQRTCTERA